MEMATIFALGYMAYVALTMHSKAVKRIEEIKGNKPVKEEVPKIQKQKEKIVKEVKRVVVPRMAERKVKGYGFEELIKAAGVRK